MQKSSFSWILLLFVVTLVAPISWHCEGSGEPHQNTRPITRLSNIPPPDSFIVSANPRLTLYWVGDDPDGYVVAFRYRWSFKIKNDSALPFEYKNWRTLLNLVITKSGSQIFALMTDADEARLPVVYKWFATLPPTGLYPDSANALDAGDTLVIEGARVWASNPAPVRYPVHINANSGTFIFDSQDTLNPHTFEVYAVDNTGEGGIPAKVSFGTPQVVTPNSEIVRSPSDTELVIGRRTDTFPGLLFEFRGFDPNSRTIEFSWVVDRDQWPEGQVPWSPFSQQTIVQVDASDFPDSLATDHTFYVRAKNEFGAIDTLGYFIRQLYDANNNVLTDTLTGLPLKDTVHAEAKFYTIYPPFLRAGYQQKILLLNNSYDWGDSATIARPSQGMLNSYYSNMFNSLGKDGKYDIINVIDNPRSNERFFPGRGTLGNYSLIVFMGDVVNFEFDRSWGHMLDPTRQDYLMDYCAVGGKMVISSWSFPWVGNIGTDIITFMTKVPHMQDNILEITDHIGGNIFSDSGGGFIGAVGLKGYPNMTLDMDKVVVSSWGPRLPYQFSGRPYGFGETIYQFDDRDDNPPPILVGGFLRPRFKHEGRACGTRYLGITYSVVYFGLPLYYMQDPTPEQAMRKALDDIGELNR